MYVNVWYNPRRRIRATEEEKHGQALFDQRLLPADAESPARALFLGARGVWRTRLLGYEGNLAERVDHGLA